MRYTSTRSSLSFTFEEAICSGYAPDGGLFVPRSLPQLDVKQHLIPWSKLSYSDLAQEVLRLFVSREEVSDVDLERICDAAFGGEGAFDCDDAVPVRKVGSVYVAELFHGPTFCFKDLGMRAVVNLLSHFATLRRRRTTLLVSTTGDTGPAAVRAVSDASNPLLTILVHYPSGQISAFQRKQLTTVRSPFVRVAAFEGGGDDMDLPIKRILTVGGREGDSGHVICGVNSYNIGRPLMQMVHYIWTYFRVCEQISVTPGDPDVKVDIVLPTGAMGNIAGGYMARKMGVPLGLLCAGVNINDVTHRAMSTGKFCKSDEMERTLSEAINVQWPYNFERLLYYLTGENDKLVNEWMTTMEMNSKLDFDPAWHSKMEMDFRSARVTDNDMCDAMRTIRDEFGYYVDPHTAVAFSAAKQLGYDASKEGQEVPVAILATASPCKFKESVTAALGKEGWEEYVKSEFPDRAHRTMDQKEVPPTVYGWAIGAGLSEVQMGWEQKALGIIKELGVVGSLTS